MESILESIKALLGIPQSETGFNDELVLHINSALSVLNQLGVGPEDGFALPTGPGASSVTWDDLLGEYPYEFLLGDVKLAIYLRVRLSFDYPQHSFMIDVIKKQLEELDWRIIATMEDKK